MKLEKHRFLMQKMHAKRDYECKLVEIYYINDSYSKVLYLR